MLGLPASTQLNKRIPKQKFYDNLSITPETKRVITEQINTIFWRNKLAVSTLNIAEGRAVTEIEVFEIRLNQPNLDNRVLQLIDRDIPYHLLFVLIYDGKIQVRMGYKEASLAKTIAFKVGAYYSTDWLQADNYKLQIQGLNMDAVYEGFLRQIAGDRLQAVNTVDGTELGIREAIELDERRSKLIKQIEILEKKIKNEKQFNRQVEMNAELKELKKE